MPELKDLINSRYSQTRRKFMDLEQIRKLLEIFDESSTAVMDIEEGNLKIHLEKDLFDADDCLSVFYDDDFDDEPEDEETAEEEITVDAENTL